MLKFSFRKLGEILICLFQQWMLQESVKCSKPARLLCNPAASADVENYSSHTYKNNTY